MKTRPVTPAQIDFGTTPGEPPRSATHDDIYHPRIGAPAQAGHVFLQGNGLPARWAGRARFVILETGFGLGNNFLATWQAWRADPARCARLFFVSIERHPLLRDDLARAHATSPWPLLAAALLQAWPPLTPNLHALDFDDGHVQLLLCLGDVAGVLPGLRVLADAFYLDGFAPAANPQMWQPRVIAALGRKAAPGATLATWSVARELRQSLASAGFDVQLAPGIGGKRQITTAHWAPRFHRTALPAGAVAHAQRAVVVGAGIAGAAAALALARLGIAVTVIDRRATPASEASGNAAGLVHGSVHGDDGSYARLYRAAALQAKRDDAGLAAPDKLAGNLSGMLRLEHSLGWPAMRALLQEQDLPADYVRAVDAAEASHLAGVPLASPAWLYAGGGWIAPPAWVNAALAHPRVRFVGSVQVSRLGRGNGGQWLLHDHAGQQVADAPIVVLAHAASVGLLLAAQGHAPWPLSHSRGQITQWATSGSSPLQMPVAGDGYAIPLPGSIVCGATRHAAEPDGSAADHAVRHADHLHNIERVQRLTGLAPPTDAAEWQGRTGWRLHSDDRLPIAGAVPLPAMPAGQRLDQARLLPREQGLFVLTALGARGLTLAPLLGRLVAAQATGTPWPLEQDLADAIDPGRWIVRAARAAQRPV